MVFTIPWYVALFQSVPETFLVIILGFKLYNMTIDLKKVIFISFINATAEIYIRKLLNRIGKGELFGVHTLLIIVLIIILLKLINKTRLKYAFIAILSSLLIIGISQSTIIPILFDMTWISFDDLIQNPKLNIWLSLPSFLIMIGLYFLISKKNFYILDLNIDRGIDNVS